jgi:dsRNA-specific ribonuclease
MGVYLCLTDNIHNLDHTNAVDFDKIKTFENIRKFNHTFIFIGEGTHKIKKKAEQMACLDALNKIEKYEGNKRNMTV